MDVIQADVFVQSSLLFSARGRFSSVYAVFLLASLPELNRRTYIILLRFVLSVNFDRTDFFFLLASLVSLPSGPPQWGRFSPAPRAFCFFCFLHCSSTIAHAADQQSQEIVGNVKSVALPAHRLRGGIKRTHIIAHPLWWLDHQASRKKIPIGGIGTNAWHAPSAAAPFYRLSSQHVDIFEWWMTPRTRINGPNICAPVILQTLINWLPKRA